MVHCASLACCRFLEQGANVTLHYNRQKDTLDPLLEEYKDTAVRLQADSTVEDDVAKLLADAVARFGVVHILVANHAIYTVCLNIISHALLMQRFCTRYTRFA